MGPAPQDAGFAQLCEVARDGLGQQHDARAGQELGATREADAGGRELVVTRAEGLAVAALEQEPGAQGGGNLFEVRRVDRGALLVLLARAADHSQGEFFHGVLLQRVGLFAKLEARGGELAQHGLVDRGVGRDVAAEERQLTVEQEPHGHRRRQADGP